MKIRVTTLLLSIIAIAFLVLPTFVMAADSNPNSGKGPLGPGGGGSSIVGSIEKPPGIAIWGDLTSGGLVNFLNAIFRLMIIIGGAWTLLNIIIAGYQFLSSGGKPESIQAAWAKIWQSLIGLLFVAGAFVLAAIFSQIIFGDARAIIDPKIIGPR